MNTKIKEEIKPDMLTKTSTKALFSETETRHISNWNHNILETTQAFCWIYIKLGYPKFNFQSGSFIAFKSDYPGYTKFTIIIDI